MERKSETSLSTNLNDPPPEVDCLDCNLRLVCPLMEREISFSIAKSGFRLVKRNATKSFKGRKSLGRQNKVFPYADMPYCLVTAENGLNVLYNLTLDYV